jgi:hypothetical protein
MLAGGGAICGGATHTGTGRYSGGSDDRRRRRWQVNEINRRRRKENDGRWRRWFKAELGIIEHEERPLDIDDFIGRWRRQAIINDDVLSARDARIVLRHRRVQPDLQILPELGHLQSATARPAPGRSLAGRYCRGRDCHGLALHRYTYNAAPTPQNPLALRDRVPMLWSTCSGPEATMGGMLMEAPSNEFAQAGTLSS